MARKLITILTLVVALMLALSAPILAAEMQGTVSAVDDKGMATIKTTDGKELKASIAGVKTGDKVDCHVKDGKTSCHKLGSGHK
jgi:translation initiation factor IF-1